MVKRRVQIPAADLKLKTGEDMGWHFEKCRVCGKKRNKQDFRLVVPFVDLADANINDQKNLRRSGGNIVVAQSGEK